VVLKSIFVVLSIILLFPFQLFADEGLTFDLGEIIVASDEEIILLAPSTEEIPSTDIEVKNAQTVDSALDFVSGVRVTVGQKNEPYVMIRGFDQDKMLLLLDGIPISSPYYGYVDLNQIPTESISKIKVIKGAVSPLYGANAIGGVINIVTKEPGEKPYLEVISSVTGDNTQFYALNCGAKSKDLSFWISGGYRESDGFEMSKDFDSKRNEDGDRRENSDYLKNSLSLKLGLESYDKFQLTVFLNYIDNEKGLPPHASSTRPRFWRFTQWKRWMTALAGELELTDNFLIKGRVFYDKYDNTLKAYDTAAYTTQANNSSWTSVYDEEAIGSSLYFHFDPNDSNKIKGSVNFKNDMHQEQDDTGEPWEVYETRTYSFGLEDELALGEKVSFLLGSSFDLFDQARTFTNQKGENVTSFNPVMMANYRPDDKTLFYGSVSKRTSFPTMNQLYSETSGNPDLDEQINVNYEGGLKHNFKDITTVSLSYFYNNVEDLIERASKNDPYLNISKSVFAGVEAGINSKIGKYISAALSYTYLYARDKNPDLLGRSAKELSYIPEHKLDLELEYTTDFGFSCDLLGAYHGKRYYYDTSGNQHGIGGYLLWNAQVSQKFFKYWQGSISVENIFDVNYEEEEGYPQPGRAILFSAKGTF